jgi:hypothetical protein
MPLLTRNGSVNGGFQFRQPEINWVQKDRGLSFNQAARAIQQARANNPHAGLNPDFEACARDLELYTCERLHHHPKWCIPPRDGKLAEIQAPVPIPCGSCGKRRG